MNLPRFTLPWLSLALALSSHADEAAPRTRSDPPVIASSWDDLLTGVKTRDDWEKHRAVLKQRYLELIRDQHKPAKVPLDLKIHDNDGIPLTQRQRTLMLLKIADVYELTGKPENVAFFIHGRGHSVPHESRELIYGFLDTHLKPAETTTTRLLGQ